MDTNLIYCGVNLEVIPKYLPDESIDQIYIDPPFNTSRQYEVFWGEAQERRSFEDRFGDVIPYIDWMRPRIRELYRVLKPHWQLLLPLRREPPRVLWRLHSLREGVLAALGACAICGLPARSPKTLPAW